MAKKAFHVFVREENVSNPNKPYRPIIHHSQKPYVQLMKLPKGGESVGLYRKFVGLQSGHTYKVSVNINTNEMGLKQDKDWVLSVHATHNGALNKTLNEKQFLGTEALPNGKGGLHASQISELNSTNNTCGKYAEQSGQVTLPEGVNSITVWVRLQSSKTTDEVSIDGIKLEDLGIQDK
jgi:hypothetical protein